MKFNEKITILNDKLIPDITSPDTIKVQRVLKKTVSVVKIWLAIKGMYISIENKALNL